MGRTWKDGGWKSRGEVGRIAVAFAAGGSASPAVWTGFVAFDAPYCVDKEDSVWAITVSYFHGVSDMTYFYGWN